MIEIARLYVLDVGHGNSAIAVGDEYALIVDAAPSAAVVQAVEKFGIERVDTILISHRDRDHARGVVTLLARRELEIGTIFIGADAAKNPAAPDSALLLAALYEAKSSGRCRVSRDLDAALPEGELSGEGIAVEVLAPTYETAMTGPGGLNKEGAKLTSNAVSAVVRITLNDGLSVLLPGDADESTLKELIAAEVDLSADVLVFPHHGSLGGVSSERSFARDFTQQVNPSSVLFSIARGRMVRPSDEIVRGVFDAAPGAYIACTQLSAGCRSLDYELSCAEGGLEHVADLPAAGAARCHCCAGSIELDRDGMTSPESDAHQRYLEGVAETPMCRTLRPA